MDATFTPRSGPPAFLRPLVTTRGWTQLTHHLLGLPLGIAYFVWIVTGLTLGAGLAITLVGIPILTLVLANVRPLLMAERGLANALLGTRLPPLSARRRLARPPEGVLDRSPDLARDRVPAHPLPRRHAHLHGRGRRLRRRPAGPRRAHPGSARPDRARILGARHRARGTRAGTARGRPAGRRRLDLRGHGGDVARVDQGDRALRYCVKRSAVVDALVTR